MSLTAAMYTKITIVSSASKYLWYSIKQIAAHYLLINMFSVHWENIADGYTIIHIYSFHVTLQRSSLEELNEVSYAYYMQKTIKILSFITQNTSVIS